MSGWKKGMRHTEETKLKMSMSQKGHIVSEETKRRISLSKIGKSSHHTDRWNKRIGESVEGDNNGNWSGNEVGYHGLHKWIKKHKPKPELCEKCKKEPPRDLANISGLYKRDITDFEWICRRCHMSKDGRMKNLISFRVIKD